MGKRPQKKKKIEIIFDAQKRKDFLTGFRKRKNERKKKAKEEIEVKIKEERKRIKREVKDGFKNLKKSFEPLKVLSDEEKEENEYEDDAVKVKIVELSSHDIAKQRNFLGENRPESSSESEYEDNDINTIDVNDVPGMGMIQNNVSKKFTKESNTKANATIEFKSKKDMDRITKKKTLKGIKKTQVFKMKEKLQQVENRKRARREKRNTLKSLPKYKFKAKFNNAIANRIPKGKKKKR